MDQDSFSPCTDVTAMTVTYQTSKESGASPDIVVRVRAVVVQIEVEHTSVAPIVPIATTASEATINNPVPKLFYFLFCLIQPPRSLPTSSIIRLNTSYFFMEINLS